ncbi:hypothetical protein BU15DRAFT_85758 [Melanogaster broomeanus]|nr:hypothetical protein BU15DRAFT_85758 [Melanogaster broomeanus]
MWLLPVTLLFSSYYLLVDAGGQAHGENCTSGDNRLQIGTYQFYSDCDTQTCPSGQFCPDEGDACQPLLSVGSPCQLNRDDQCEPPPNSSDLADTFNYGRNVNGAVCLNNVCMWANVTVGQACEVENTAYIAYAGSREFIDVVSRGNCQVGSYCDSQQLVCMQMKAIGASCDADKEVIGVCGISADTPNEFGIWVYVLVGVGIFGGADDREKRVQYWREQVNARDRRASILSVPGGNSNRSTIHSRVGSEESGAPMMQHTTARASGLRQYIADDGSVYDEGIMMQSGRR